VSIFDYNKLKSPPMKSENGGEAIEKYVYCAGSRVLPVTNMSPKAK
jgi:hypothetical protein